MFYLESLTATVNYYRAAFQIGKPPRSEGSKLKVPNLSIFGTKDKYLSVEGALGSRKYVENFTQEFVDNAGHWIQMEVPDKVNEIMSAYLK